MGIVKTVFTRSELNFYDCIHKILGQFAFECSFILSVCIWQLSCIE